MPTMLGEEANAANPTPTVQIIHDVRMATFRPQLSAKYGMTKNPSKLPTNIIDVSTVAMPDSSHIRNVGSKANTIELECLIISVNRSSSDIEQTKRSHYYFDDVERH